MKKYCLIVFLFILLVSCSNQNDLVDKYETVKPNRLKWMWYYYIEGYRGYASGTELTLKEDSTFHLITCGNIIDGTWHCNDDSLYLSVDSNKWRKDSLQKHGYNGKCPQIPKQPYGLKVRNNKLYWLISKKHKTINILEKSKKFIN